MANGLIARSASLKASNTRTKGGNSWCSAALANSCLIPIVQGLQQHSSELLHLCRCGKKWITALPQREIHCYFCRVLCISNAYFRCKAYAACVHRPAQRPDYHSFFAMANAK